MKISKKKASSIEKKRENIMRKYKEVFETLENYDRTGKLPFKIKIIEEKFN